MAEFSKEIQILKNKDNEYWNINLMNENDTLGIFYGGNLDIYWMLISKKNTNFIIDKENYELFQIFDRLYRRIKNCQIFEMSEDERINGRIDETPEQIKQELDELNEWHSQKEPYKKLYNKQTGIIEWFSDDYAEEEANSVKIIPHEDKYEIEFVRRGDNFKYMTSIRFRNSGSRYDYFNFIFCKHYNELCEVDDKAHQISLDEIAYRMKVKL